MENYDMLAYSDIMKLSKGQRILIQPRGVHKTNVQMATYFVYSDCSKVYLGKVIRMHHETKWYFNYGKTYYGNTPLEAVTEAFKDLVV